MKYFLIREYDLIYRIDENNNCSYLSQGKWIPSEQACEVVANHIKNCGVELELVEVKS